MARVSFGPGLALRGLVNRLRGRKRPYFISHAYADQDALSGLVTGLPDWIEPRIFPPIEVPPEAAVSNSLVSAITACDGLIYLASAASRASFWVNFERRFARRLDMAVYAFDATSRSLARDRAAAAATVAPLWNRSLWRDHATAVDVCRWLREHRNVGTGEYVEWSEEVRYGESVGSLRAKVSRDAPVVLFVSNDACRHTWPFDDADYIAESASGGDGVPAEAVAWLEPPDLGAIERAFAALGDLPANRGFRKAVLASVQSDHTLVLAERGQINWNRVDDLLIRIEHMAFTRGTRAPPTPIELEQALWRKLEGQRLSRM